MGSQLIPCLSYQGPHPAGTWWAEAVKSGEQVQAGAGRVAGLGQAFVVIGLAAGARVARGTEAVEGARGVEAGATVLTGTGALLGWEERGAGVHRGWTARKAVGACWWQMGPNWGKGFCL